MGFTSMLANFGNFLWFYFLPVYYMEFFNATPFQITTIFAIWSAIAALGSGPAGYLADIIGRKNVVVISGVISAAAIFIFAFSNNFLLSALALPVLGLGSSFFKVSNTLLAESVETSKRGTAFGTYEALSSLAIAISPLIGGLTISKNGYFPLFILGASFTLLAALGRQFLLVETMQSSIPTVSHVTKEKAGSYLKRFGFIFKSKALFALVLTYGMYNLFADQDSPVTTLYAKNILGFDVTSLSVLFFAILVVVSISRFGFGRLSDKIGRKRTVILSWIGESSIVYIFVFSPRGMPAIALLGMTLWMLFGVMDGPAINAWVAELSPDPKTRGFTMGLFYSATIIPTAFTLSISGYLYSILPQLPFYVNSVLGVFAIALLLGLKEPEALQQLNR